MINQISNEITCSMTNKINNYNDNSNINLCTQRLLSTPPSILLISDL